MDDSTATIGVLSPHVSKETKSILNAVNSLGYEGKWIRKENLLMNISEQNQEMVPDVDIIINRSLLSNTEKAFEWTGLLTTINSFIPMLNKPLPVLRATYKPAAYACLAEHGIPIPQSSLAFTQKNLQEIRADYKEPYIHKLCKSTHGEGTRKVSNDDVISAQNSQSHALIQEYLDSDEKEQYDIRVYVVDGEVLGAMKRSAPDDTWKTNIAQGGKAANIDNLPSTVKEISKNATEAIGLDYAGIDLMKTKDGWKILEANPTAGFRGFFSATGNSPAPYIADAAISRIDEPASENTVENLSRVLNDSTPPHIGKDKGAEDDKPKVGYINDVAVVGEGGIKEVKAKSDTGAKRTSIDSKIAAKINAGPITDSVIIKSGSFDNERVRPVVPLSIILKNKEYTVNASIEDRSHMEYPVLLGRDILRHYTIDLDSKTSEE